MCDQEACRAECLEMKELIGTAVHCNGGKKEGCHCISPREAMYMCCDCSALFCFDCLAMDDDQNPQDERYFCQVCFNKLNLKRDPRMNFDPDAAVVPEYNYVHPPMNANKRKLMATTEETEDDSKKTIVQLAFGKWPKIIPNALAKKNPQELDDLIWLDETNKRHTYHVKFEGKDSEFETDCIQSTSGMHHQYFPNSFNPYGAIEMILRSSKWGPNHPKHGKYYSNDETELVKNLRQMLDDWDKNNVEAIEVGKFVHFLIECHCNKQLALATHPVYANLQHIQQYLKWRSKHFDPFFEEYRTEFRFRSDKQYRRVGTCDLLAIAKNHGTPQETNGILHVTMFDWKNCILKTEGFNNEKGLLYCSEYPKCNFQEYTLQQNDYKKMGSNKRLYGKWVLNGNVYECMEFDAMYLIAFHETNPNNEAIVVPLEDRLAELEFIWRDRAEVVAQWEAAGRPKDEHAPYKPRRLPKIEEEEVVRNLIRTCAVPPMPMPGNNTV